MSGPSATLPRAHFVPQMYLRGFGDPTRKQNDLWRYAPGFSPQPKSAKSVAWEDFFYDVGTELPPECDIEKAFSKIETIAAPHLQKLVAGNIHLTTQEKSELATFISLLMTRTRAFREMVNAIAPQLNRLATKKTLEMPGGVEELIAAHQGVTGERVKTEEVRGLLQALVDGNVIGKQTSKAWTIKQAFVVAVAFDAQLQSMPWNLLEAPAGEAFITSDNPVLLVDPARGAARRPKEYGGPSAAAQFHLPASPKHSLVAGFIGLNETAKVVSSDIVKSCNENQIRHAHREVYASFRSDGLQQDVDRIFADRQPLVPTLPDDSLDGGG